MLEQACLYLDLDGRDPNAAHLVRLDEQGLVAYLRAFPPGEEGDEHGAARIGRVLVAPRGRGTGLGRARMEEGLREVGARHPGAPIRVAAQAHLERFYASLGFRREGDVYDEDGIPHVDMIRRS